MSIYLQQLKHIIAHIEIGKAWVESSKVNIIYMFKN